MFIDTVSAPVLGERSACVLFCLGGEQRVPDTACYRQSGASVLLGERRRGGASVWKGTGGRSGRERVVVTGVMASVLQTRRRQRFCFTPL